MTDIEEAENIFKPVVSPVTAQFSFIVSNESVWRPNLVPHHVDSINWSNISIGEPPKKIPNEILELLTDSSSLVPATTETGGPEPSSSSSTCTDPTPFYEQDEDLITPREYAVTYEKLFSNNRKRIISLDCECVSVKGRKPIPAVVSLYGHNQQMKEETIIDCMWLKPPYGTLPGIMSTIWQIITSGITEKMYSANSKKGITKTELVNLLAKSCKNSVIIVHGPDIEYLDIQISRRKLEEDNNIFFLDTQTIFRNNHGPISLRRLAKFFLNQDIQNDVHNPTLDAKFLFKIFKLLVIDAKTLRVDVSKVPAYPEFKKSEINYEVKCFCHRKFNCGCNCSYIYGNCFIRCNGYNGRMVTCNCHCNFVNQQQHGVRKTLQIRSPADYTKYYMSKN